MVINTSNDLASKASGQANHKVASAPVADDKSDSSSSVTTTVKDQVQLSAEAQGLAQLESKIHDSPGVDSQKVDDLRQRINNGEYTINSERIAERILDLG